MHSKATGIIGVWRVVGWNRRQIYEALYFAGDKVIVVRTATGFQMGWGGIDAARGWYKAKEQEESLDTFSVEELLTDKDNFVITYDIIEKVELKKFGKGALLKIKTAGKKYNWTVRGLPNVKSPTIDDLKKVLEPIFQEKLEVSNLLKI